MRAIIIQDATTKQVSRIGEEVKIIRKAIGNKVWIKLKDGTEYSFPLRCLKIIKEENKIA